MLKIPISQKMFSASFTQEQHTCIMTPGAGCWVSWSQQTPVWWRGWGSCTAEAASLTSDLSLHNVGGNFLCHDPSPTLSRWSLDQTLQPTTLQTMLPQLWCPVPTCFLSYDSSIDVGMVMRTKPSRPVHWCFCWGCVRFIHKRFMSESRKLLSHLSICLSDVLCTITISYNS